MLMQLAIEGAATAPVFPIEDVATPDTRLAEYKVIRRNGAVVAFEPTKIAIAMTKAFLAVNGGQGAASARVRELVSDLTSIVVSALMRRQPHGGTLHIEDIQDQVELALMRSGEHEVARRYVLYREERARERARSKEAAASVQVLNVVDDGIARPLDMNAIRSLIDDACEGLGSGVDGGLVMQGVVKDLYDGVPMEEVRKCAILAARSLIEKDPAYSYVTARLLLNNVRHEVLGEEVSQTAMATRYAEYFAEFIAQGIDAELLDPRLAEFDLKCLGGALDSRRDLKLGYLGLQTLYDRYFLHIRDRRIELPQAFFMKSGLGGPQR
jgi:ribonucleoside-diphosphate reductase alpha chain